MANQGGKKRKEENIRHMRTLHHTILFCNVVYLLVRFGIFYSSLSWMHGVGLLFTSIAYFLPYQQLTTMAKPSYGSDGELLDGGYDMSTGGVCGYLHDVIYITCFVQLASILSGKFWYTYLVIPGFAVYKSSGFLKGFLSSGSEKMRRLRKRERRWKERLQELSLSRRKADDDALLLKRPVDALYGCDCWFKLVTLYSVVVNLT